MDIIPERTISATYAPELIPNAIIATRRLFRDVIHNHKLNYDRCSADYGEIEFAYSVAKPKELFADTLSHFGICFVIACPYNGNDHAESNTDEKGKGKMYSCP